MRILLVEDDRLLGEGVQTSLQLAGYTTDWVQSGKHAIHALGTEAFDLCVLDIGLPDLTGFEVLRAIRQDGNRLPVLILTARDKTEDKVKGLDLGADDYVLKPFDVEELLARIRALVRRYQTGSSGSNLIEIPPLTIDTQSHSACLNGRPVNLTPKEYRLLSELAMHRGRVLSRAQLTELVYGWSDDIDSNAIEVHLHNLRKKLGKGLIRTVRGFGYKID